MKTRLSVVIKGLCLSLSLLSFPSFAEETATDKKVEPAAVEHEHANPRMTEKAKPVVGLPEVEPALKNAIDTYIKAWQAQDFKTLRSLESWEGGDEVSDLKYLQAFDADFHIYEWKITKLEPQADGQVKVLVLVSHNVNKQFATLAPDIKSVNSTLMQWWKKEGEKYVHLFNIERQNLMNMMPSLPTTPPTLKDEEGDGDKKAEEPKKVEEPKKTEEPKKI
ncbi:MAG: hypothetical protein R3E08_04245 [Thiotrichaceae bacterium]